MIINNIPNILSFFRLLSVFPFFVFIKYDLNLLAFLIFVLAAVSDFFDGFLARRWHISSRFGAILDPLADKVLMLCSYGIFYIFGDLPFWCSAIVIGRDVIILLVVAFLLKNRSNLKIKPLFISKLNTTFQLLLITTILFFRTINCQCIIFTDILIFLVTFTTVISGLAYLIKIKSFYS